MHKMSDKEKQLHIRAVLLLLLMMAAIAMLGEVSRQNWNSRVTAYPTKTEEAIEQYARKLLSEMSLEEQVGQMFFATDTSDPELAAEHHVGGVLLGEQNTEGLDKNDVIAVVSSFQGASDLPLFIGVNEEGGSVNTLSGYAALRPKPFLSPQELMTTGGLGLVESDAEDKSAFLRQFGVNLNFAPLCDVTTKQSALLYDRALGADGDDTARYVETVVRTMKQEQVVPVMKHFPGYGDLEARGNDLALTDRRSREELEVRDFLPFRRGIEAGGEMILMGHTVTTALDRERPASLSSSAHQFLRRQFGFDGVIISQTLDARGLSAYGDRETLAVQAVKAGNDMLLTPDFETQIPAVVQAVRSGEISRERIQESVLRILKLKIEFGILA